MAAPRPTIKDVALRAGVSKSTVSKYLNGAPYVSDEAVVRIEAAIRELQFVPSSLARGLVTRQSRTIGVVINNIANPFFAELVDAVEIVAQEHGYDVVTMSTRNDPERRAWALRRIRAQRVDAIIDATSQEAPDPGSSGQPVVWVNSTALKGAQYVVVDNFRGGWLAAEHLLGLGHRALGVIHGPRYRPVFRERVEGFLACLDEQGVPVNPRWLRETHGGTQAEAAQAMEHLLLLPDTPTAVFGTSDFICLGAMQTALGRGWKVPEDLSLVGFDNIPFGASMPVPLTTVDGCTRTMGELAARALIEQMGGGATAVHTVLAPSLVVRASTGRPRGAAL